MKSRLEQLLDELLRQIDIPAMEQAMSKQYKSQIRRRWELPADYWMLLERCCGLRTVWSNDTYEALELWGLDTLVKGQEGYAYNPVEQKVIKDWDEHLVVIASDAGDPYCLDLRRNDTSVFWAEHGAGTWDFQPAFDCLEDFLESVLDVPKTQEYETAYPYHYIRLIVTGISDTKKALVFLKQHFGDSSFQQTKDRLKELPLLIYSGLDTGTAPLENSLDRWGLMYEKQQISLEIVSGRSSIYPQSVRSKLRCAGAIHRHWSPLKTIQMSKVHNDVIFGGSHDQSNYENPYHFFFGYICMWRCCYYWKR